MNNVFIGLAVWAICVIAGVALKDPSWIQTGIIIYIIFASKETKGDDK